MATEAGHIQISEFSRDVIPQINWMMEDLFCQYGVSIPYFMLDYDFPDYSERPDWVTGYSFNLDWGEWGYWLPWFNELLGLLWDEAHLPRLTLSDLSLPSVTMFNDYTEILYDNMQRHYVYDQTGTFTKDEVIEGETSGITGWYKWTDGDGYIHVANKQDASGEPVADFEDEKITGADSGAYAYTYAAPETARVYHAFTGGEIALYRRGRSQTPDGYAEAWDVYDADGDSNPPTYRFESAAASIVYWGTSDEQIGIGDFFYYAQGNQTMLEFDTSDIDSERLSSIVLHIDVEDFDDGISTPIVKFYKRTGLFEVTYGDWNDVSNFVAEQEVSDTTTYDIALSDDDINYEGSTFYKVRLAKTDVTQPSTEAANRVRFRAITTCIWLEFTY